MCVILDLEQQFVLVQQVHSPGDCQNGDLERLRTTHGVFVQFLKNTYMLHVECSCIKHELKVTSEFTVHARGISDAKVRAPKSLRNIRSKVHCNGSFSPPHLPFLSLFELHCRLQVLPGCVLVGEHAATKQCTYT